MTEFIRRITERQNAMGLTETEIGDRYGFKQQTFNAWKHGVLPRPVLYAAVSAFLGIKTEELPIIIGRKSKRHAVNGEASLDVARRIVGGFAPQLISALADEGWHIVRIEAA